MNRSPPPSPWLLGRVPEPDTFRVGLGLFAPFGLNVNILGSNIEARRAEGAREEGGAAFEGGGGGGPGAAVGGLGAEDRGGGALVGGGGGGGGADVGELAPAAARMAA